jgi:succinate dehydrogenase/fumarate reductase cytochrome b subunit
MHGLFGLVLLVLDILAIVKLVNSNAATDKKILWTALIILLPLLGLILWYLIARDKD